MKHICKIKDCGEPIKARGYCSTHYQRWYHHGDPNLCYKARSKSGTGSVHYGYKLIYVDGKKIFEHRHLIEKLIGRKLNWPDEVVHHINGDRSDNRIENLKLMKHGCHSTQHNRKTDIVNGCKRCSECNRTLPTKKFAKVKTRLGVRANCMECVANYNRNRLKKIKNKTWRTQKC